MNPKFRIWPAVTRELVALDVEYEQIVCTYERRTRSWRKNIGVGAGNARADMAERGGDALLVQNMAGGDDVLLDTTEIHFQFLCFSELTSHTPERDKCP